MATKKDLDATTGHENDSAAANMATTGGGALAGGVAGGAAGAAVGGPLGATVGAAIGAVAGAVAGDAVWNDAEPEFRREYEESGQAGARPWDQVAPAYRYGWESYGLKNYRGRTFDQARADLAKSWKGAGRFEDVEPMARAAWERRGRGLDAGQQTVVPVVEEELKVGKRKVETGGVTVERNVTETPVEQQVRLHEEHVTVERRPVDRPLQPGDAAFQEGTMELTETAEEAVVAKHPRVVEEIVLRKEGRDRTETVRDTVRRTDVDVQKTGDRKVVGTAWDNLEADFRADSDRRFKTHGYSFEQSTPAYRYGYNLAGDERYRTDWSTTEPEARRHWEERNPGTWEQFKDAVRHAWERARS